MSTLLIVNADDFALTEGVSTGILRACRSGIVTATTALMTAERAVDHIARARKLNESPGLGVHLNMTYGRPLSERDTVDSLIDSQGMFTSLDWKQSHRHDVDPEQARREWTRQIDLFLETGATLDHLDCHHFAAALTVDLWEIYLGLASEYRCGLRPLPETSRDLAPVPGQDGRVSPSAGDLNQRVRESRIPAPDHFLSSFYGSSARLDHLLEIIRNLPSGKVELMVHPGLQDAELSLSSGYTQERQRELEVLTDPAAREALSQRGVKLVDYRGAGLA